MTKKKADIATIMGNMEKYIPGDAGTAGIDVDDVNALLVLYCYHAQSNFGGGGVSFMASELSEWFLNIFGDILTEQGNSLITLKVLFESSTKLSWYLKRNQKVLDIEMSDIKMKQRILWCAQRVPQETGEDSRLGFKEAQELVEDLITGESY